MDTNDFDDIIWQGDLNWEVIRNSGFSSRMKQFLEGLGLEFEQDGVLPTGKCDMKRTFLREHTFCVTVARASPSMLSSTATLVFISS